MVEETARSLTSLLAAGGQEESAKTTILGLAAIAGIVGAGVLLFALARRWRKKMHEDASISGEVLSQFRDLRQQGELSQAEFQRIRASLAEQIRRDVSDQDEASS